VLIMCPQLVLKFLTFVWELKVAPAKIENQSSHSIFNGYIGALDGKLFQI